MSQIGRKFTIWLPKQSSMFEKVKPHRALIFFLKIGKNVSKMVRSAQFFYFNPNCGSSETCPQKISQIRQKLTIWWPKQSSVFEKVKPHRARILFWKLEKTCPKWFALPNFFILSPTMAQVELAHKKSQIGQKLTIWWPKQSLVFEKVKPHRARILFRKSIKTCPKWFVLPNFFLFYPH